MIGSNDWDGIARLIAFKYIQVLYNIIHLIFVIGLDEKKMKQSNRNVNDMSNHCGTQ